MNSQLERTPPWLGWSQALPGHWRTEKLKHVSRVTFSSVDKHRIEGETPVRLCNYVDVYYNERITSRLQFMEATATREEIVCFNLKQGDVIITKDSEEWTDIAVPAHVAENLDGVLCGYHLALIRPNPQVLDGAFLLRVFAARGINDQFRVASTGITRYGLGKDSLGSAIIPVPPIKEQRAIAARLDREAARIDALIEKKQRQIELLQEKRAAVISRAVTKGLNLKVRMKSCGLNCLGSIPEHWQVKRLKFITPHVTVGIVVTPSKFYVEEGVPCLRSLNVKEGRLTDNDLVFISTESNELHAKSKLRMGDIVAVRSGRPGTTAVVDQRFDGANCIDLIIIRQSTDFDSFYLSYAMGSQYIQDQFGAGSGGAIQQHFNIETASNLLIALPPRPEQEAIRDFLNAEAGRLTALQEKVQTSITKLHEYRTALISAAVTGKLNVREEVAA